MSLFESYFTLPKQLAIKVKKISLHSYFISAYSNILSKSEIKHAGWHPWWELDVLIFKWQLICWRADWWHLRGASRLPHPFPSPDYCLASFTRQIYFFSFFPQCGVRSQATCSCSFPTICVHLDNSVDFFGINRMPARSCWITNISQSVGLHVSETPRAMLAGDLFPGAATHARHVEGYGRGLTKRDPLVFHVGGWIKD